MMINGALDIRHDGSSLSSRGGNERDPLNLNALIQQKKQKTSQTESINLPKSSNNNSSSEDVTIEIMLPPNTRDPLKLDDQRPNLSLSATSKRKDVTPFRKRRYRQISQSYSNRNHFVTSPFIPPHISHMASIAPFAKYISPPIRPLLSVQTSLPNSVNNHSNLCSPSFRFGTQYYNQNRANPTGFPVSLPYNNNNNRQ
ncbi:unnamed protein product, partial [Didymodactylos carnosus]